MTVSQQNLYWIRTLRSSLTIRIISTSVLIFACYFTIGLQLAVVPSFVHLQLGYNAVLAGLAISAQYVATLISRPIAGRMSDSVGAKHTVRFGLLICATSGLVFLFSAWLEAYPLASFAVLIASRLILGFGESSVATGATVWGIGRVGGDHTAQVISWSGIASYGALAVGAPSGVWVHNNFGVGAIGVVGLTVALAGFLWASATKAVRIEPGKNLAFGQVLGRILPYGLSLALGGIGLAQLLLSLHSSSPAATGKTRDCRSVFSVFSSWPRDCFLPVLLLNGADIGSPSCLWRLSAPDSFCWASLPFQPWLTPALPWPALGFRWYSPLSVWRQCEISPPMTVVRPWAFIPPLSICPWESLALLQG